MALIAIASILLGKAITGGSYYVPLTLEFSVLHPYLRASLGQWVLGSTIIGLVMAFYHRVDTLTVCARSGATVLRRQMPRLWKPATAQSRKRPPLRKATPP